MTEHTEPKRKASSCELDLESQLTKKPKDTHLDSQPQLWESDDPEHPANLIPELCRLFYTLGWVTGTGGGITIKKECMYPHAFANAVLATLLYEKEFVITHQEMIKGIRKGNTPKNYKYYDRLVVPIIENTAEEADLKDRMAEAMRAYPESNAVLVRRHGVYVWGQTWQKAKSMTECYDYLFEIAVKMKSHGIDPSVVPAGTEYA
ncbi:hypothetical protein BSLG_004156 [Batrachochytrium salamandrivorans]|nr:hypothetical protein BSLG_004156 [Batrachochytrium salamandrivorans]